MGTPHPKGASCESGTTRVETMGSLSEGEGFTGTFGAVKPRSSLDVTDLRSVKSTDDK